MTRFFKGLRTVAITVHSWDSLPSFFSTTQLIPFRFIVQVLSVSYIFTYHSAYLYVYLFASVCQSVMYVPVILPNFLSTFLPRCVFLSICFSFCLYLFMSK